MYRARTFCCIVEEVGVRRVGVRDGPAVAGRLGIDMRKIVDALASAWRWVAAALAPAPRLAPIPVPMAAERRRRRPVD